MFDCANALRSCVKSNTAGVPTDGDRAFEIRVKIERIHLVVRVAREKCVVAL